jgi:hypothetical protein
VTQPCTAGGTFRPVAYATRRRLASGVGRLYRPRSGLRRELGIAVDHLRSGGVRLLASKAVSRVAYATGRKLPPAVQG